MSAKSAFRGLRGIEDVRDRMQPLAEWYRAFKPDVTELVLERADYDLLKRWPRAAHLCGFDVVDGEIFYSGLRLTYDTGQGRYAKPQAPQQAVIE